MVLKELSAFTIGSIFGFIIGAIVGAIAAIAWAFEKYNEPLVGDVR